VGENKKNAYIMGRITWETFAEDEKCNPHLYTVVTSTTLTSEGVPYLQKVLPGLDAAIDYVTKSPVGDQIEKVFIMGGGRNYEICIDDPRLKRIWVTRIFGDFKASVLFPKFDHKFKRVTPLSHILRDCSLYDELHQQSWPEGPDLKIDKTIWIQ
ncbi:hypothetical protein BaRGS_00002788, partial [Batillaria attramentaria]